MMVISILKICENDINFIKQLEVECKISYWSKKDYLDEINREDSINLILIKNKIKCGFLIARMTNTGAIPEAEIYNIAIKDSYRNNNFGTMLLENFINIGLKNKLGKIFLEVRKSNHRAISFYKKNKFFEIGKRPNFYNNPTEDAILMGRDIVAKICPKLENTL